MKSKQKLWLAIICCFLTSISAWSQDSYNLSGKWLGTANWGVQNFEMALSLEQDGQRLDGQIFTQNLNKSKSATYKVSGAIVKGEVYLRGIEFIHKIGAWCLPGMKLTLNETQEPAELVGGWKNNSGTGSCWVSGSGKLKLQKVTDKNIRVTSEGKEIIIASDDKQGKALRNELQKQTYHALIIGVQDYKDQSIVDLDQPITDARDLMDELVAEYSFEPKNITFLQNPDRTKIIETFDQLTTSVDNTDNLLVFYAGHGIWDKQIEQGYWLPSDAKKSSKAAWLSNGTIRDYIRAIDSKHTLLITDACFGGGILKTRDAFTASKAMLEMYKLPSRKAMTSGALKTVPDKSIFIKYLIKALKNNEKPLISADQLFTNFKYNVINNSPNGQVPQYGVISQADDEGGDFIFLKK
jgi:hypothetical protein